MSELLAQDFIIREMFLQSMHASVGLVEWSTLLYHTAASDHHGLARKLCSAGREVDSPKSLRTLNSSSLCLVSRMNHCTHAHPTEVSGLVQTGTYNVLLTRRATKIPCRHHDDLEIRDHRKSGVFQNKKFQKHLQQSPGLK